MTILGLIVKRARLITMAKRKKKAGRSSRHGNMPSPYQKYKKVPYRYSTAYYEWRSAVLNNRSVSSLKDWKSTKRQDKYQQYAQAAE